MATSARCLICGKFYQERGPEPTVCESHIYDWNAMTADERAKLIRASIHRKARG